MDKQRIVIMRSVKEADLFDQMPSPLHGDWWLTLLCHSSRLFDRVIVDIVIEESSKRSRPVYHYHWYPRCIFKSLLLVSAILLANSI